MCWGKKNERGAIYETRGQQFREKKNTDLPLTIMSLLQCMGERVVQNNLDPSSLSIKTKKTEINSMSKSLMLDDTIKNNWNNQICWIQNAVKPIWRKLIAADLYIMDWCLLKRNRCLPVLKNLPKSNRSAGRCSWQETTASYADFLLFITVMHPNIIKSQSMTAAIVSHRQISAGKRNLLKRTAAIHLCCRALWLRPNSARKMLFMPPCPEKKLPGIKSQNLLHH